MSIILKEIEKALKDVLEPYYIEHLIINKNIIDIEPFIGFHNKATDYIIKHPSIYDIPTYYSIISKVGFIFETLNMNEMRLLMLNHSKMVIETLSFYQKE